MYELQTWEREYEDVEKYKIQSGIVRSLMNAGVYIPSSISRGLMKFISGSLVSTDSVDRCVDGGPRTIPVLYAGALYKKSKDSGSKPLIVRQLEEVLGVGDIKDIPDGTHELEKLWRS